MSDFQVSPELLAIYLEDARQHLEALDHCLLTLEREGPDAETIAAVARPAAHPQGQQRDDRASPRSRTTSTGSRTSSRASRDGALALEPGGLRPPLRGRHRPARRDRARRPRTAAEARDLGPETRGPRAPDRGRRARRRGAAAAGRRPRAASAVAGAPAPADPPPRAPSSGADARYTAKSSMVRVDFAQLDHLLNLVGELIIHRTKLQQMAQGDGGDGSAGREAARELLAAVQQVAGVSAAAPGDGHGRADAAHPPRLRALPAPGARPRARDRARRSS